MKIKYISNKFNYSNVKLCRKSSIKRIIALSIMATIYLSGCSLNNVGLDSKVIQSSEFDTEKDQYISNQSTIISNVETSNKSVIIPTFSITTKQTSNKTTYDYEINNFNLVAKDEVYNDNAVSSEQVQVSKETVTSKEEAVVKEEIAKEKKLVAITFDDGPSKYTSELVDILEDNEVNATFFVIGSNISKYKDSVVKAYKAGNEIGIHTYSHKSFTSMTISQIKKELDKTRGLLEKADVDYSNIVRPPYGNINKKIQNGIDTSFILWSVDTRDWESKDKDKIIKEVKNSISEGSIILFHDIYPTTIKAIKELLPELTEEYEFVTVSELFERNDMILEENQKYYKIKKK